MKNNKACNINKITALGSVVKVPVNRTRAYNSDTITEIIIRALLIITILLVGYPLYNIVVCSISDPVEVNMGRVIFWPRGINFGGYVRVLKDPAIIRSFFNTIKIMVLGTAINIFLTVPTGYALSRKDLKGNKYILWIYLFTMFFFRGTHTDLSGGTESWAYGYISCRSATRSYECLEHDSMQDFLQK